MDDEQHQNTDEESTYQRALELQSHRDSYEDQMAALDLFQSIYFYKDADRHVSQCTFRAWEIRWDKRKRIAFKVVPIIVVALVVAFVAHNVNQNMRESQAAERALAYKYDQAASLAEEGEYALAIDAFTELGDYRDAPEQVQQVRATAEQQQIDEVVAAQPGDKVTFGFYHDQSNERYGLVWRVLAREGDRVLLTTNSTVELMPYNSETNDVSWENSTLRAWMNDDFISSAFTPRQQEMLAPTDVTCDDGVTLQDTCFALSVDEARDLFPATEDWAINEERSTTDNWWLRSSSTDDEHVDICWMNGSFYLDGYTPTSTCGVRVSMWVNV